MRGRPLQQDLARGRVRVADPLRPDRHLVPPQHRRRVLEAADVVAAGAGQSREQALRRIGVSPQCGFASHHLGNAVTRDDMIAKLKLVRQVADSIWPGEP